MGGVKFVKNGCLRLNAGCGRASHYRALLYVFVSALTFEADYFAPASYFSPFFSVAPNV